MNTLRQAEVQAIADKAKKRGVEKLSPKDAFALFNARFRRMANRKQLDYQFTYKQWAQMEKLAIKHDGYNYLSTPLL